jgi:thiaminase/transcriptional activator TenA
MTAHPDDTLLQRLIRETGAAWPAYVDHRFVRELATGTLPAASFRHYLMQDYVFLLHFSRAWALAVYKAENLADMRAAARVLHGLLDHEMGLHVQYCESWGIDQSSLEATEEATGNMAYTRYVLERGLAGDLLDLLVALAPCVCGYAEIGRRRISAPDTMLDGNPYRDWLELYAGDEFQQLATSVEQQVDRLAAARATEQRWPSLARTFGQATCLEIGFWDMGLAGGA